MAEGDRLAQTDLDGKHLPSLPHVIHGASTVTHIAVFIFRMQV